MNEGQDTRPNPPWPRIIAGLAVLAVFLATVLVLWRIGILDRLRDGAALEQAVMQFGPLGPFLIIGLMTVAIVMSPIPSAPIALASGAAYGHYWGAFYVAIGSEIGALTAFGVARLIDEAEGVGLHGEAEALERQVVLGRARAGAAGRVDAAELASGRARRLA